MSRSPNTVHTFCRYCPACCGVEVTVRENPVVKIAADKQNPHSWHDFCAKGRTAAQVVEHPRRITAPERRVDSGYLEAGWDEAGWDEAMADIDAVGTCNRYAVGSVDQNAAHVVAEAIYGSPLLVPVSDIDRCDNS